MMKFLWSVVWRNARILKSKGHKPALMPNAMGTYDLLMFQAQWILEKR